MENWKMEWLSPSKIKHHLNLENSDGSSTDLYSEGEDDCDHPLSEEGQDDVDDDVIFLRSSNPHIITLESGIKPKEYFNYLTGNRFIHKLIIIHNWNHYKIIHV